MQSGGKLNIRQFVNLCLALTRRCADLIREVQESGQLGKVMKGEDNPVTVADFKAQYIIQTGLLKRWPGLNFVGEESDEHLIASDFDFDAVNVNCDIPELAYMDVEFDIEDLTVYCDPLDGTTSFVKDNLEAVTTLIGLAHKGKPLAGIIGQIWCPEEKTFKPCVYAGLAGYKRVVSIYTDSINSYRLREVKTAIKREVTADYTWKVACSVSHYDPDVENFIAAFEKYEKLRVSGMGAKYIACIEEKIDAHIQNRGGSCRWDILSGQVLLEELGGRSTDTRGIDYTYDGIKANAVNNGVFFINDSKKFAEVVPKFIAHLDNKQAL